MGNVYDFFSKRNMADLAEQDYKRNEALVESNGRYVGRLPKNETAVIRNMVNLIGRKKAQIDNLIAEFNHMYEGYAFMIAEMLAMLNVDESAFDPATTNVYVDENGHVWLVSDEKPVSRED